jgi:hypothetical protein
MKTILGFAEGTSIPLPENDIPGDEVFYPGPYNQGPKIESQERFDKLFKTSENYESCGDKGPRLPEPWPRKIVYGFAESRDNPELPDGRVVHGKSIEVYAGDKGPRLPQPRPYPNQ